MRTERILSIVFALVLLASAVPMAITPAAAYEKKIPCDADGNNELTKEELVNAILPYMLGEGSYTLDDVGDAAWVYAYWDGKPKTIVDSAGRTVTIYKPIKRVVCTFPQHIEALRTLKVPTDTIVGVPSMLDLVTLYPEFADVPCIGMSWEPDVEAILALHPDLVLLAAVRGPFGWSNDPACEDLEAAGVSVIRVTLNQPALLGEEYTEGVATIPEEMETLGYVFDKEEEAEEYNEWHVGIVNSIVDATSELGDADRPKVYCEWAKYQVAPDDDDIIEMAGGRDIFAGVYGEVDKEYLIDEDPDIIIRVAGGLSEIGGYGLAAGDTAVLEEVRKEIMGRVELQNVTAVKNGDVYVITPHLWTYLPYSGNKALIGICYMEKWFEPFTGLDLDIVPKDVHQQFIDFQGVDIDLDEQGVFVYPEE